MGGCGDPGRGAAPGAQLRIGRQVSGWIGSRAKANGESAGPPFFFLFQFDGVVRYIGKGKDLRLYCHMKEVRSRLNRDYRLQNIGSRLQQNLTKAALSGAKVIERVLVDNLTKTAAYKLEYDKLREYVFAGKRDQLWNAIPASIQTPRELQAFTERTQRPSRRR